MCSIVSEGITRLLFFARLLSEAMSKSTQRWGAFQINEEIVDLDFDRGLGNAGNW